MVHYIIPAPVPVMHAPAPIMDPRQQLASLAGSMNRRLTTDVSYDPHSRTYGCRISEPRIAPNGAIGMFVVAEVFSQSTRDAAEILAVSSAIHALSNDISRTATAYYGNVYR